MDEELLPAEQPPGDGHEREAAEVAAIAAQALEPGRMPAVYLGHGAPPLVDDPLWVAQLAAWAGALPRPRALLVISAHWLEEPPTLGATTDAAPLIHDFYGFPERYYQVEYPAPGAPDLATRVRALLEKDGPVARRPERGLDHGAYVPLTVMYPDADVPVLQLSLPSLEPRRLLEAGARLRPLRDDGVMIMGSGFLTHGLPYLRDFRTDAPPPAWSRDFDSWAADALEGGETSRLRDFRTVPSARYAHPTVEHLVPLFVTLGAAEPGTVPATPITGFWMGLSKRSIQVA